MRDALRACHRGCREQIDRYILIYRIFDHCVGAIRVDYYLFFSFYVL